MKVLVVDHDGDTRIAVSDQLSRLGVNHATVATGGECLARLISTPAEYSLVLLDIHLPALSGVDVCSWIKGCEVAPRATSRSLQSPRTRPTTTRNGSRGWACRAC